MTSNYQKGFTSPTKKFDERLNSKLSEQSPVKSRVNITLTQDLQLETNSISSGNSLSKVYTLSTFQWSQLSKISDQIFSPSSKHEHGDPTLITISDEYIAIATSKCNILLFNYKQILLMIVKTTNVVPTARITSMALSIDSTYLVVGYSNGFINLWDLKKKDPIISITPITFHELQFNGTHHHIAHLEGSPIRRLLFIGSRHTGFISSDESGMVIYHNGGRSLIGYMCRSKIIFGKYDLINIASNKRDYSTTTLDISLLPIGTKRSITDELNLFCIITPHEMIIQSLNTETKIELKFKKPKIINQDHGMSGCSSWYPAIENKNIKEENLPMLAYAWSNVIKILEIKSGYKINDEGDKIPIVTAVNKRQVESSESIICIRWLNNRILMALTRSQKLLLYDSRKMDILKEVDLMTKQMKYLTCFVNNNIGLIEKDFSNSFFTLKSNVFLFQHNNIIIGNLCNWADVLLELLNNGKYVEALEESKRQYEGGDDMPLLDLPDDNQERHKLIGDYLIQIFKSSLKYISVENSSTKELQNCKRTTLLLVQTCLTIHAPIEIYDLIYEKLLDHKLENVFFEILENFIFSSEITTFSPIILKAMVTYYIKEKDVNTLERLICLLDIQQLDIDLTVTLCKQYHLNETLAYIWTTLLHDYFTPLMEAIQKIKIFNQEKETLSETEINEKIDDISYVYPYISYSLTGRQYPTDKLISFDYNISAKLNIYYFLFNGSTISWPIGSPKLHTIDNYKLEPAFPYLCSLLKFDSESMITSLNEAFEDDLLNDNEIVSVGSNIDEKYQLRINRQYIIDVLLGIFHDQTSGLTPIDNIRIAIFVTRNYPKYLQFIRIADSISDEMIITLCQAGKLQHDDSFITPELVQDCELGLQSLLAVYKPYDISSVIIQVKKAGYYQVLLYLYQVEAMYIEVLKLWVEIQRNTTSTMGEKVDLFKPIPEIIESAINNVGTSEREEIIKFIDSHFEMFVSSDPKGIARIICKFCPELNSDVIDFKNQSIKFEYLKEIFDIQDKGVNGNGKLIGNPLKVEFLKSLIKQKKSVNIISNTETVESDKKKYIEAKIENFVLSIDKLNNEMINILKSDENDEFEVLIKWYEVRHQYRKAMNTVCEILRESGKRMETTEFNAVEDMRIWKCINKSFSLLSIKNSKLYEKNDKNITLGEDLLLQLVETSVEILTRLTNSKVNEKCVDVFKRVVQSVFTFVINICREDASSFNDIFKRFLDGSSSNMTKLGDVHMVLKEIFLSYCNDRKILEYIQILVDEDIFQDLMVLESLKVKGWSPKNIECEACGRKIWGGKIGNRIYESWMNYKLKYFKECDEDNNDGTNAENVHSDGDINIEDKMNELYVFQCRHSYHRKCLENMGMVNDVDKKCILCRPN